MAQHALIDIDHFPCGCLITTQDTRIVFANRYFHEKLDWDINLLVGQKVDALFSKPTQLFCQSYIMPTVLNEGQSCEVQVSLLNADGASIPKVASVRRMPNGNLAWVFLEAENRNRLFHELETARQALQEQREQLELLALTDHLTGLANRRNFENLGQHILERAKRSSEPLSLLLLDIDHFKVVNDTYGHDAGDKALCVLADVLKSTCRESDIVARLGGDEFVCLLSNTGANEAASLCERIRVALEKTDSLEFTVSIGIVELAAHSQIDLQEFLKQADEALYSAKREGRNRSQILVATQPNSGFSG